MNDKQKQIIEATICLFAKDGVGVATAKIAKEAGVSNGTLFNYFDTKQALIEGVYLYIKEKMAADIIAGLDFNADMKTIFLNVWQNYSIWSWDNTMEHQVINLLTSSQILSADVKKAEDSLWLTLHDIVENGIKDKTLIPAPDLYLCDVAAGQLNATILYARANNFKKKDLPALVDLGFSIYWNGISNT